MKRMKDRLIRRGAEDRRCTVRPDDFVVIEIEDELIGLEGRDLPREFGGKELPEKPLVLTANGDPIDDPLGRDSSSQRS